MIVNWFFGSGNKENSGGGGYETKKHKFGTKKVPHESRSVEADRHQRKNSLK